jgi:HEAT repeat protein
MEKRSARLFQHELDTSENNWNIVELESRRNLRHSVHELIRLAHGSSLTTDEIQQQLLRDVATFGNKLATQLVRSLNRDNTQERQSIVWLLTLLHDDETIPLLQRTARDTRLSRGVRLSASLALAGMGATTEVQEHYQRRRLYALG